MRIAAIQHDIVWEDSAATRRHVEPMVAGAVASGAGLVVLTEMFATGFSMEAERIAEPEGGPTSTWIQEQAASHGVWLYGSVAERPAAGGKPRNVGVLAGPDGTTHRYAKLHPFTFAREHEAYDAGEGTVTVEVGGLRVSLFICYDLRFADDWWPLAPATDLYLCCANWPEARRAHWQALLQARAIENQAYVLGRQPGRRGWRRDLLGRQPDLRPAGRDAGRRGPDRDDPPGRRRRGRGGQGARPLPLPARPPHRRAVARPGTPAHIRRTGHDTARPSRSGREIAAPSGNFLTGTEDERGPGPRLGAR